MVDDGQCLVEIGGYLWPLVKDDLHLGPPNFEDPYALDSYVAQRIRTRANFEELGVPTLSY
jgi:hypothetical protein